jgi:membrane protein implicated in regulation of membrane protease activity
MFSKDVIAGVWVPLALGLAFLIAGWALPLVAHDLPPWVPPAAFIVATLLVLVAVVMGRRIAKRASPAAESVTVRDSFNQNVTSHNQQSGVTAHSINVGNNNGRPD